jgi:hypothetical protein
MSSVVTMHNLPGVATPEYMTKVVRQSWVRRTQSREFYSDALVAPLLRGARAGGRHDASRYPQTVIQDMLDAMVAAGDVDDALLLLRESLNARIARPTWPSSSSLRSTERRSRIGRPARNATATWGCYASASDVRAPSRSTRPCGGWYERTGDPI